MKKLLIPTIALLLLLASVLCFGAAADGAEPSVAIPGHNLALEDSIHIIYYVDFQNVPAGAEKGVLIWTAPRASYTYGTQNAKLTQSTGEYGSYLKYEFTDVAAKMMAQDIYAVAYIKNGNSIIYSALDKYSVLQYAMNKKTSTSKKSGGTATLGEMVTGMLEYGATAQKYFNYQTDRLANAAYYQITVENGTLADGTTKGLYPTGTSLTLTANEAPEGYRFAGWKNASGTVVGTSAVLTLRTERGAASYTAAYEEIPVEEPSLVFTSNGDGTCSVSGIGTYADANVVIPETSPNGDTVTGIASKAFQNCDNLTGVVVPDSVTSIGAGAFSGCSSLESITIPFVGAKAGVTASDTYQYPLGYIFGTSSYTGGTKTEQHFYSSSTSSTYDSYNYYYIPASLKSVTVTGGNILRGAFYNCKSLTSVTIPDSVTSIEDYAFYECTGLTSVTIPDSVTSIGYKAFNGCSRLIEVHNLSSLTIVARSSNNGDIGYYAKHIYATGESYLHMTGDGYVFYDDGNEVYLMQYQGTRLKPTLPENYNGKNYAIYLCAFSYCTSLTSITIPDSVTSIGSNAFYGCTNLTSVYYTGDLAGWCGISFVGSNSNPLWYAHNLYIDNQLVTEAIIPDGVTGIGSSAFSYCTSLTSVTIPNGVTSIGGSAFYNCKSLTSVTIPDSVTSIGSNAFYNCTSLTSITIPDSVTSIGREAFCYCTSLTSVTIPDSVTSIERSAFYNCTSLTSITIPNSVTSIGNSAFYGCYLLIEVRNLSALPITARSSDYGYVGYYAKHVYATGESYLHKTEDGYFFYDDGNKIYLVQYQGSLTELTLPENYNGKNYGINTRAFCECYGLTSVTIGNGVTSIGNSAFYNCTSLTNVTIGNSITSIGNSAFYNCTSLTNVTIGNSVTSIEWYAFSNCTSLMNVTIGNSVTSIGQYAFSNCTSLMSVTIGNSVTSIGQYAFSDCTRLTSVTWNAINCTGVGGTFSPFCGCTNLTTVVFGDQVTNVPQYAFYNCTGLTSITIPDSVTSIGSYAFYDCTSLTSVTIPDSVTSIGSYAFYDCTSLTSVTIPDSVTSIGDRAFYGCSSLTSVTFENTSGWYRTQTEGATSGTNMTVTNPSTNAKNLRSNYRDYYWYRK